MSKLNRKTILTVILSVTVLCLCIPFAGIASTPETPCMHIVSCDNMSTCTICGAENLQEKDITGITHPYAYCYEPDTCAVCGEVVEESSISRIVHSLNFNVKYVPEGTGHKATCACGEVEDDEISRHLVFCTQEDQTVCSFCGAEAQNAPIAHTGEQVLCDKEHHWLFCFDCNQQTSPLLDHYTLCTHPDGACDYCEMEHDECVFKDEFIGMHLDVDEIVEENGEFFHIATCTECKKETIRHKGLVYEDFGDDETHIVKCEECGHQFDDQEHGNKIIKGAVDATCTKEGYTGDEVCEDCGHVFKEGSVIEALGHEYQNGVCVHCNAKQSTVPATGDTSNVIMWIVVMAGAGACLLGCIAKQKTN